MTEHREEVIRRLLEARKQAAGSPQRTARIDRELHLLGYDVDKSKRAEGVETATNEKAVPAKRKYTKRT